MATYEITAPDGTQWEVTAPDSASEDEVLAYAQKHMPGAQRNMIVDPALQADRDRVALQMRKDELSRDPTNTALQRDVKNWEKKVGSPPEAPTLAPAPLPKQATSEIMAGAADVPFLMNVNAPAAGQTPMDKQKAAEDAFDGAVNQWRMATGGALQPGQNERQAAAQWSGLQDPRETANQAELEHLKTTGELPYGDSIAYGAAKGLASMGGWAAAGPAGATAAETGVRMAALTYNLQRALNAGAIDEEKASDILTKELLKGGGIDAAMNFGLPMLGKVLMNTPGLGTVLKKVGDKLGALAVRAGKAAKTGIEGEIAPAGVSVMGDAAEQGALQNKDWAAAATSYDAAHQAAAVERARAMAAATPEQRTAVGVLAHNAEGGYVPTPGQVTGQATHAEKLARIGANQTFENADKALQAGAEQMRRNALNPVDQPAAFDLGKQIQDSAMEAQSALKKRLRPTFQAADEVQMGADMSAVVEKAQAALAADEGVRALTGAEKAKLQGIINDYYVPAVPPRLVRPASGPQPTGLLDAQGAPIMSSGTPAVIVPGTPAGVRTANAETLLDFLSARKADTRAMTADGMPTTKFKTIMDDLVRSGETAYDDGIEAVGAGHVKAALSSARDQYKKMMSTVFDDAMQSALKKNPEDVGRLVWQSGNVSEVKQLHDAMALARNEGVMSETQARDMAGNVTRGFLQEAVKDIKSAANWTQTLHSDPLKRRTWETLTSHPGGEQFKQTMKILEEASKMALRTTAQLGIGGEALAIPLARAASGGLGVSWVTGALHPGMYAVGISANATVKAMATAYTQGNTGVVRDIARVLKSSTVGTPAAMKAMQAAIERLEPWLKNNNAEDVIEWEQLPPSFQTPQQRMEN